MSFSQIKELRLDVNDPPDVIDLIEVNTSADLPVIPLPQTAYKVLSNGGYFQTELESGAVPGDYTLTEVYNSDVTYQTIIDSLGIKKAICRALALISRKFGSQLRLIKTANGADSEEFIKLSDLYNYYSMLSNDCKSENSADAGTNTGAYATLKQPEIAGGNL